MGGLAFSATPRRLFTRTIQVCGPATKTDASASGPRLKAYAPARRKKVKRDAQNTHSLQYRRIPLIMGSVTAGALSFYLFFLYRSFALDIKHSDEIRDSVPADTSSRYNSIAKSFDADVDSLEWILGITRRRQELVGQARGHVLESAVGTCRNSEFYPLTSGRIRSITMVDKSREMIDVAREKWGDGAAGWFMWARFFVADVNGPGDEQYDVRPMHRVSGPVPSVQDRYDTVVQTMGVCSTGDPVGLLRRLGEICRRPGEKVARSNGSRSFSMTATAGVQGQRPTKRDSEDEAREDASLEADGGRILLLEHGRSYYDWLNRLLDAIAPSHAERYGCWFNKDVGDIVRQSGLQIVEEKRFHAGTTWWYVLKPPPDDELVNAAEKSSDAASEPQVRSASSSWSDFLRSWLR